MLIGTTNTENDYFLVCESSNKIGLTSLLVYKKRTRPAFTSGKGQAAFFPQFVEHSAIAKSCLLTAKTLTTHTFVISRR